RSAQISDCAKRCIDLLGRIDDAASQAGIGYAIRSRRSDNAFIKKALHDLPWFHCLYIKANDSGRKILVTRCVELNIGHPSKPLFQLTVQFMYARRNSGRTDVLVKTNSRWQRPIMFKSLESARRKPGSAKRHLRFMFLFPRLVWFKRKETGNHRTHFLPNCRFCPNKPCASGSKQPFMGTGGKRIASQVRDLWILHAESVHTIDDQEHPILLWPIPIRIRNLLCNTRNRKTHTTAGVDPCHAHCTRFWSDCLSNTLRDFIRRDGSERIEQRNLAPGRSATAGGQSNGFVMHIVIVRRC